MRYPVAVVLMSCWVVACACKKDAPTAEPTLPLAVQAVSVSEPEPGPPQVPDAGRADFEQYIADCAHPFQAPFDNLGELGQRAECESRDFEQNCDPDQDGCWDAQEKCKDDCAKPCGSCQVSCTGSCNICKSSCAGSKDATGCIRACAQERQVCRTTCLASLEACRGPKCDSEAKACVGAAQAKREKLCPGCAKLKECIGKVVYGVLDEPREAFEKRGIAECDQKHNPTRNSECLQLCYPDP